MTVQISDDQARVREFLEEQSVGVLSTVAADGSPDSAAIYFVVNADLSIDFMTKSSTHKHKNLKRDKRVALVVFDAKYQTTAQIKGNALEITDKKLQRDIFTKIVKIAMELSDGELPPIEDMVTGRYSSFRIEPTALRLAVFSRAEAGGHSQVFETII